MSKATERIAQLDEEIIALKSKLEALRTEIGQFSPQRDTAKDYTKTVGDLLGPVNTELKVLSAEVKPIELRYRFDLNGFKDSMIQYAELIHCLSMDDSKITKTISTTIEDLEHRELLLALEGGEKAFHQREKRYGID